LPFGLEGTGTFGSAADVKNIEDRCIKARQWSQQHNIPVILSEFGSTRKGEYNARMNHYATVVSLALKYEIPFFVWDDGGDFQVYLRTTRTWNEIKDIIINTYPESPNNLIIGNYADTLIQLQWNNRNPFNNRIVIERKINTGDFIFYKDVAPTTNIFIDSKVLANNSYYYYRLKTLINGSTYAMSYPVRLKNIVPIRSAYNNTPAKVPGTVEAEKFDVGMEGIAYHDADRENLGGYFRLGPGVDIYRSGSIYYVAHTQAGEWMEYTLSVQKDGLYKLISYASSPDGEGYFKVIFDNTETISFVVSPTPAITPFSPLSQETLLTAGEHIMRVLFTGNNEVGLDRLVFQFLTNIPEHNLNQTLKLFPNPVTNYLSVRVPYVPATLSIYSVDGALINAHRISHNNQIIDISKLSPGLYIAKCVFAHTTYTGQFIKK
ncbi:MAG: T9SS type A sorting domain-containing protein, partial [Bacteroidales bacterium]